MLYVLLIKWSKASIAGHTEHAKWLAGAAAAIERLGGSLEKAVWTQGRYDVVLLVSARSPDDVAAFSLLLGTKKGVRTETLRAFDDEQFESISERVPDLDDAYTHAFTQA